MDQLTLKKIDEGRILEAMDEKLREMGRAILGFKQRYPAVAPSKAEIVLKITAEQDKNYAEFISVKCAITSRLPGEPTRTVVAYLDSVKGLVCQQSGASQADPRQTKMGMLEKEEDEGDGINFDR